MYKWVDGWPRQTVFWMAPSDRLHDVLDALQVPPGLHPVAQRLPTLVHRLTVRSADEVVLYD